MSARRRQKGTGGLKLRGRLWSMIYIDAHGKRRQEPTGTDNRAVAARMLQDRVAGRQAPLLSTAPPSVSVEELLKDLETYQLLQEHRAKGVPTMLKNLRAFFGGMTAEQASKNFYTYAAQRRTQKKANATINRELGNLVRAFALARREQKITVTPSWEKLPEAAPRKGFLSDTDFETFRNLLSPQLQLPFTLGFYSGMRAGEVVELEWSQVDWDAKEIRLNIGETKNGEARTIPLDFGDLFVSLKRQHQHHIREYPFSKWICTYWDSTRGGPNVKGRRSIQPGDQLRNITRSQDWKEATIAFGRPGLIFHDLRRTAAKEMIRKGVPRSVAMKITGHKTESMFERYNIVETRDLHEAARRVTQGSKNKGQLVDNRRVREASA